MSRTVKTKAKRAVNLSVRSDLIDEAKAFGTNISAVLEAALEREHKEKRAEAWKQENAAAIRSWNEWIEKNGIPLAKYRLW